jgi:hypothetical protein
MRLRFVGLVGLIGCAPQSEPGSSICESGTAVGDCAPQFALPDRDGHEVRLDEMLGELVLVNCSAMW